MLFIICVLIYEQLLEHFYAKLPLELLFRRVFILPFSFSLRVLLLDDFKLGDSAIFFTCFKPFTIYVKVLSYVISTLVLVQWVLFQA